MLSGFCLWYGILWGNYLYQSVSGINEWEVGLHLFIYLFTERPPFWEINALTNVMTPGSQINAWNATWTLLLINSAKNTQWMTAIFRQNCSHWMPYCSKNDCSHWWCPLFPTYFYRPHQMTPLFPLFSLHSLSPKNAYFFLSRCRTSPYIWVPPGHWTVFYIGRLDVCLLFGKGWLLHEYYSRPRII